MFNSKRKASLRNELKTDSSERYIPISDEVLEKLKERKASTDSLLVFHNSDGGCYTARDDDRIKYFLESHVGPEVLGKNKVVTPFPVSSHTFRHPYVKLTTNKISAIKQKSQTISKFDGLGFLL